MGQIRQMFFILTGMVTVPKRNIIRGQIVSKKIVRENRNDSFSRVL